MRAHPVNPSHEAGEMQAPYAAGIALVVAIACYSIQIVLNHSHSMRRSLCAVANQAHSQSLVRSAAECLPSLKCLQTHVSSQRQSVAPKQESGMVSQNPDLTVHAASRHCLTAAVCVGVYLQG